MRSIYIYPIKHRCLETWYIGPGSVNLYIQYQYQKDKKESWVYFETNVVVFCPEREQNKYTYLTVLYKDLRSTMA